MPDQPALVAEVKANILEAAAIRSALADAAAPDANDPAHEQAAIDAAASIETDVTAMTAEAADAAAEAKAHEDEAKAAEAALAAATARRDALRRALG